MKKKKFKHQVMKINRKNKNNIFKFTKIKFRNIKFNNI